MSVRRWAVDPPAAAAAIIPLNVQPADSVGLHTTTALAGQHAEMHVSARVGVRKSSPGAGGMASCDIRVSGVAFTSASNVTFSDAGTDAAGNPALPTETLYIEANGVIGAGRYNVGVRCWTDRPDLAQMSDVELSVKAFNAS